MIRTPAARNKPRKAELMSFPAPVGGWIKNENRARPNVKRGDGSKITGAEVLENWFPTFTGCRMRGGSQLFATIGDGTDPVVSMFQYNSGATQVLFAATATDIYDITNPSDPETSPTAAVSSLTNGNWSVVQFTTSGGTFLRAVNGANTPRVFDGTTWGTSPAITGATPANLDYVWQYKNRLFFIEKNSLDAWYLPVDAIGGSATKFPLGAVFPRGGKLLFGASWSLDENSGLTASCAFVTTEGEVAVYQGSDPGTAADWTLAGVYRIGRPLGRHAWMRAGGDLVIATDVGMIPLSQAVTRDFAALSLSAVSRPIEDAWNRAVRERSGVWNVEIWPTKQFVGVSLPGADNQRAEWYVVNSTTGAWAVYTGWRATCLEVFGTRMFYGAADGQVIEIDVTGADIGAPYTATCAPLFEDMKSPASLKIGRIAKATYMSTSDKNEALTLLTDFETAISGVPDAGSIDTSASVWSTALWGTGVWSDTDPDLRHFGEWQSVAGEGYALTVAVQITSGAAVAPNVELVRLDLTYETGDIVT
jgi:hypothetical protein